MPAARRRLSRRRQALPDSERQTEKARTSGPRHGAVMTILHNVEPPLSLKGCHSESQCCIDCGYNTNPGAPPRELAEFLMNRDGEVPMTLTRDSEIYLVRNKVWKAAGMEPWGGCLCVGCLERRIGRRLKPKDFELDHVFNNPGLPRSDRLSDRLGY